MPLTLDPTAHLAEAPHPVLFNAHKHHAGFLKRRIAEVVRDGPAALPGLASELLIVGGELMDVYHGALAPADIGARVAEQLRADRRLELPAFRAWLAEQGHYAVVSLPDDGSRWCLRLGDEAGRYLHIHPARWAPHTLRVRANVLKTAVLVLAYTGIHGGDPLAVPLVNRVRADYLGLAPLGRLLAGDQGIGAVIDLLQS